MSRCARAVKIEAPANMTASFESFGLAPGIVAPVFISDQPSAPLDPSPPQCNQALTASSPSAASRNPDQPIGPAAPAAKRARQSRRWNAGWREARDAAERQAQLRHAPRDAAAERSARAWATSEDVIHLRLAAPEQPARDRATSEEDVIHLHLRP
jgi:hypothetical protein